MPILVITGATASGKSALALAVARLLPLEIVSADAFAVYRGLEIGTDAPSPAARAVVPHHLVGHLPPTARSTAGDFAREAASAITDITRRGAVPAVVGGSLLYLRALLAGLFPAPPRDPAIRAELERRWADDADAVRRRLAAVDPAALAAAGPGDRQRILRALGHFEQTGTPISAHRPDLRPLLHLTPLVVFPDPAWDELCAKIEVRVSRMFSSGWLEEVDELLARGVPRSAHALKAIGYHQALACLDGSLSRAEAIAATVRGTTRLARRQLSGIRGGSLGSAVAISSRHSDPAGVVARLWAEHWRVKAMSGA
jgi:tRNA dimethylallyltransferase